MTEQGTCLK